MRKVLQYVSLKRILQVLFLCLAAISLIVILNYYLGKSSLASEEKQRDVIEEEIAAQIKGDQGLKEYSQTGDLMEMEMSESEKATLALMYYDSMQEINPDYRFSISIPNTNIDYPVVKRDNSYYLSHSFYDNANRRGAIFLDENCDIEDEIILVHGHHMKDGTMFANLSKYLNKDFCEDNQYIYADFDSGRKRYKLYSVNLIDVGKEVHWPYYEIPTGLDEIEQYAEELLLNECKWKNSEAETMKESIPDLFAAEVPAIIVLSTCEYQGVDQRLIVVGIRE